MNIVAKQGTRLALVADDADLNSPVCKAQVYNTESAKLSGSCMLYRLVANGGWDVLDELESFEIPKAAAKKSEWSEDEHPRDEHGRFEGGGTDSWSINEDGEVRIPVSDLKNGDFIGIEQGAGGRYVEGHCRGVKPDGKTIILESGAKTKYVVAGPKTIITLQKLSAARTDEEHNRFDDRFTGEVTAKPTEEEKPEPKDEPKAEPKDEPKAESQPTGIAAIESTPTSVGSAAFDAAQKVTADAVEQGLENTNTSSIKGECKAEVATDIASRLGDKYDAQLGITPDTLVRIDRETGEVMSRMDVSSFGTLTDERIAQMQSGEPANVLCARATDPSIVDSVRQDGVSRLVNAWAQTSNDTNARSLAMQEAASREFGLTNSVGWDLEASVREELTGSRTGSDQEVAEAAYLDDASEGADFVKETVESTQLAIDNELREKGDMYQAVVRAQYESTQDYFAKAGVTEVAVARGMVLDASNLPDWAKNGTDQEVPLRPLSSFSYDPSIAAKFAASEGDTTASLISGIIPVDRILSCGRTGIGCLGESEIVVMAGAGKWAVATK